jgi:hypothetical protein
VRGPPPARAVVALRSRCDAAHRAQRLLETEEEGGWAELPDELVAKVLELLQAAGPSEPQDGGLGFSQELAAVRLVCARWKAVHGAMVTRLVLRRETTDEAVGMLVRRFPAVVSLEIKKRRVRDGGVAGGGAGSEQPASAHVPRPHQLHQRDQPHRTHLPQPRRLQ